MRLLAIPLLLAACAQAPAAGGGGIVSVNPCADAMLVRLVEPARIAAISHYSQDAAATSIPLAVANRFRVTAGTAEEVIALRPSLVLASTFASAATREAYARAGLRVLLLDSPVTAAASVAQVREVAAAVGERGRGEVLAGEIERELAALPRRKPGPSLGHDDTGRNLVATRGATGPRLPSGRGEAREGSPNAPAALLLISGDLASGSGNLLDELLRRAGFRNAAADYGLRYTGRVPIEVLAAKPPAVIIAPGAGGRTVDLRRKLLPGVPQATFPSHLINCGGPSIVPALARLRAIRATLP